MRVQTPAVGGVAAGEARSRRKGSLHLTSIVKNACYIDIDIDSLLYLLNLVLSGLSCACALAFTVHLAFGLRTCILLHPRPSWPTHVIPCLFQFPDISRTSRTGAQSTEHQNGVMREKIFWEESCPSHAHWSLPELGVIARTASNLHKCSAWQGYHGLKKPGKT
jgi:hypothetical protein